MSTTPSTYTLVVASVVAVGVPSPVILLVAIAIGPLIVPPANGNFVAIAFVNVVLRFASSLIAAAISFNVLSVPGAPAIKLVIAVST